MATVLTLYPTIFPILPGWLRNEFHTGNVVVNVPYPNVPLIESNALAGAAALDDALHTTSGYKIVLAHSLGSQVACLWLRNYGPTSDIDPAEVEFVLGGNPERKYGGSMRMIPGPDEIRQYISYGGPGLPEDTPYTVRDFARQYDFFADWPSDSLNMASLANIAAIGQLVHGLYFDVGLSDPENVSLTEGNVTYIWSPTALPLEVLRPAIESGYDRPVEIPFGSPSIITSAGLIPFTGTDHDDFTAWAREIREYRIERAYERPNIKLYDGDWVYRGTVYGEIAGHLELVVNESGTIQLRLPIDNDDPRRTWAAFWALDEEARGTANIHIIVETMGARIGGRMKAKEGVAVKRGPDGDEVVIDFLDDVEELKFIHTAANPFLPISLIQQPKAWMLYMQADYAIMLTMAANLLRLSLTNIDVGGLLDLLNPENWTLPDVVDGLIGFWQQSQIIIKPRVFDDSAAPLALVVGNIKTNIYDIAAPILEDAELQWDLRRWLTGDPEPWPGAGTWWIRNGTLFVDIVDKSGFRQPTSLGGNLLTGLTRTVADLLSNHVEDSYDLFTGYEIEEPGYRIPGILGTTAPHPYVIYRDGDITGIQTSEFSRSPGGPGRITVGGQSMPGVNELISAAIRYGGDVLGDNINAAISAGFGGGGGYDFTVGSLGAAMDAFLNPIYRDSILAFISVPLLLRTATQGWGHYLETASTDVTQAFTPSSVMDLRKRRRETDPEIQFTLKVAPASPWLIGANGFGHWWHGDRVGGTSRYLMPRVFVRRNRKLTIDWGEANGLTIDAEFANTRTKKDALERIAELTAHAMGGLQQIGLW